MKWALSNFTIPYYLHDSRVKIWTEPLNLFLFYELSRFLYSSFILFCQTEHSSHSWQNTSRGLFGCFYCNCTYIVTWQETRKGLLTLKTWRYCQKKLSFVTLSVAASLYFRNRVPVSYKKFSPQFWHPPPKHRHRLNLFWHHRSKYSIYCTIYTGQYRTD
jgi:hypothetical protein